MNAGNYFTSDGSINQAPDFYFDPEFGELMPEIDVYVTENYTAFSPKSDLVALFFASKYANETHGNYSAQTLFTRAR